eukprot:scaffold330019_cov59-Tisochrysis_lutea.AAC.1
MWTLSTRSCAFGGERASSSPARSLAIPAIPAAGSACPAFALKLATGSGAQPTRSASTAEMSERISIGSPSGVPVP